MQNFNWKTIVILCLLCPFVCNSQKLPDECNVKGIYKYTELQLDMITKAHCFHGIMITSSCRGKHHHNALDLRLKDAYSQCGQIINHDRAFTINRIFDKIYPILTHRYANLRILLESPCEGILDSQAEKVYSKYGKVKIVLNSKASGIHFHIEADGIINNKNVSPVKYETKQFAESCVLQGGIVVIDNEGNASCKMPDKPKTKTPSSWMDFYQNIILAQIPTYANEWKAVTNDLERRKHLYNLKGVEIRYIGYAYVQFLSSHKEIVAQKFLSSLLKASDRARVFNEYMNDIKPLPHTTEYYE